ncbi:MAG: FkbM family methyltransferase [Lewinellaceae bacterium]|nr:FkbM family methyltransferase [Phaeodactylibacter sp.]MCB9037162.1 FkbM family methyltransferase [Lewinellaceae bacterium]
MNKRQDCLQALAAVEKAARGSHLQRLAFAPFRYFWGMLHSKLLYPAGGRSRRQQAPLFFGGAMEVLLPAGLDIYLLGAKSHDSEIRLARFMIRQLEEGMAMLDVGAHFGFFSRLGAALAGEQGKVLGIEAAGGTFEVLRRNIAGHANIEAVRAAASDAEGTVTFYEFPALYSEYNTLEQGQFEGAAWRQGITPREVAVPAYPLDQLMEERNLYAHFIKIDVEGAEAQVVAGLKNWLGHPHARWLAMEYLAEERHNEGHRRAAQLLAEQGWQLFSIRPDGGLQACPDIEGYLREKGLDSDNVVFRRGR